MAEKKINPSKTFEGFGYKRNLKSVKKYTFWLNLLSRDMGR